MKNTQNAFTMIELIAVMLIISVLGSIALPQFINMRNEAKAAATRSILTAMRVGMKNQTQQAMLKCGVSIVGGMLTTRRGASFYQQMSSMLASNDMTVQEGFPSEVCKDVEIPNPIERRVYNVAGSNIANRYFSGVETVTPYVMPTNPFLNVTTTGNVYEIVGISKSTMDILGGPCQSVNWLNSFGDKFHWLYINPGELYAGTNTPGISECAF